MIFQKVKIGSICTLVNGIAFKSGDFQEEGIPVLKIANVKANNILLDNLQCVSEEIAEKKVISDELTNKMKSALDTFKKQFTA